MIVHTYARRQHLVYLHVRNVRCYLPYQRPSPPREPPKTSKSEHAPLPTVVSKDGLHPLKGSRIRHAKDWGWSKWSKSSEWAARHPKFVGGFGIIVLGTIPFCYFHLQPVPITGRRQLEYVPKWLERQWESSARKEDDESWKVIAECSWGSDHPALQGPIEVLNRLLRASGMDDQDWELRIVNAPSKWRLNPFGVCRSVHTISRFWIR